MDKQKSVNTRILLKSVEDLDSLDLESFKMFDCIIHLAAETDVANTTGNIEDFYRLNLVPTMKMIEVATNLHIPLIFPSSTSVYDHSGRELGESAVIHRPTTPYAQCKLKEENLMKNFFAAGGKGVILRLGTIHGFSKGMKFHTAVNRILLQVARKEEITIWKTAFWQLRPYLSLKDLTSAMELIIRNEKFDGETYNLATDHYTIENLIKVIQQTIKTPVSSKFVESTSMNNLSFTVSTKKIENLGLQFMGSLASDVREIFLRLGI